MNERIRELATQAGYKDFDYAIIAHKFADLLIRHCLQDMIDESFKWKESEDIFLFMVDVEQKIKEKYLKVDK